MKKLITIGSLLLASLSHANAQIYLFDFSGTAGPGNSEESTGVSVSGNITVNVGAGSINFNINNTSTDPYADLTAFGFWNEPQGGGTPYTYSGFSTTSADSWTATDSNPDLWSGSYYGAVADNPTGFMANGINGGESAMFDFTGASSSLQDLVDAWTNEGVVSSSNGDQHDLRFRFQSVGPAGGPYEDSEKLYLNLRLVPEPSTYGMIGASALVLLVIARRFRKKK